jgi:hypothetical protein
VDTTNTVADTAPDEDRCPGPPEAPFPVSDDWVWAHRWTPVAIMGQSGDRADRPPENAEGAARVLEVCPSCRQWRTMPYTRWAQSPADGG